MFQRIRISHFARAALLALLPSLAHAQSPNASPAANSRFAGDESAQTSFASADSSPSITVDFGSRTNHAHPIPADMFYADRTTALHSSSDLAALRQAGITGGRNYGMLWVIYNTQTPNWSRFDGDMRFMKSENIHPMVQLAYTPPWLQPNPNPCGKGQYEVAPTNIAAWANLAASFVAHADAVFPGFVQDYEIWNEPNTQAMCGTPAANRMGIYMQLYAAAAKAMKAQAAADHATIRVGGPATAGLQSAWIKELVTNPATAPYVDFVSYHQYLGDPKALTAKWDTVYNGLTPWYARTQGGTGAASWYTQAEDIVKQYAKTPLGAKTPVYNTEYNLDWAFSRDCCRNDPTYGPLWNALYITDLLDTVYSGATQVPNKLVYFAASAYPYFCLMGNDLNSGSADTNNDCHYFYGQTPQPYPQYFAYQLMAAPNYLGLQTGGYMAASISPKAPATGLAATAFYNSAQDSLLVVNPTSANYANVSITFSNTGFRSATAQLFHIVNGAAISASTLTLQYTSGTSYTATINVPAYSVQGIVVK